jgi:hypothetical protein
VEIRPVVVGAGTLVAEAVVLHDCAVGEGSIIGSLSTLASCVGAKGARWVGSPAVMYQKSSKNRTFELLDGTLITKGDDDDVQVGANRNTACFEIGLWGGILIESLLLGSAAASVGGTWLYFRAALHNQIAAVGAVLLVCAFYAGVFVGFVALVRRCCVQFKGHHKLFSLHTVGWQMVGHLQNFSDTYV